MKQETKTGYDAFKSLVESNREAAQARQETTPIKEGLHTQKNRDLENLVSELRTYNLRRFTCINDSGYSQVERDIVDAITKPYKDERKALLDSHRELLNVLEGIYTQIDTQLLQHKFDDIIGKIKTAINNAKNI